MSPAALIAFRTWTLRCPEQSSGALNLWPLRKLCRRFCSIRKHSEHWDWSRRQLYRLQSGREMMKVLTQCPSTVAKSSSPIKIFPLIWFTEQAPPRKGCGGWREGHRLHCTPSTQDLRKCETSEKTTLSLNSSSEKQLVFWHSMVTFPPSSSVIVP